MAFDGRARFTTQSRLDVQRERLIVYQIQAVHDYIDDKLLTHEVVSQMHYHLYKPGTSTSIHNEILGRYMKSLSGGNEHRLKNELQIFDSTGQVSSFFARGQNLESFEADELSSIIEEWTVATKSIYSAPWSDKETVAYVLQSRFDLFRAEKGFRVWGKENLNLFRNFLARKYTASCEQARTDIEAGQLSLYSVWYLQLRWKIVSSGTTGTVQADTTGGKRGLGFGLDPGKICL
jgi:hypothetical protein